MPYNNLYNSPLDEFDEIVFLEEAFKTA